VRVRREILDDVASVDDQLLEPVPASKHLSRCSMTKLSAEPLISIEQDASDVVSGRMARIVGLFRKNVDDSIVEVRCMLF
jgi:hypothetical protein